MPPPDANFAAALAWLVGTAAALTALAVIGRFVGHFVRRMVRSVRRMWRWTVTAGHYVEMMHTIIERELTPNAGGSMRDKLDEQCKTIREQRDLLAQHIAATTAVQGVLLENDAAMRQEVASIRVAVDDTWRRVVGLPPRGVE